MGKQHPRLANDDGGVWSRGGVSWRDIAIRLWQRSLDHDLVDRAGLLSFYFLLAFFPLLLTLSSVIGFVLASQTDTYWTLLNYIFQFMPPSAFTLLNDALQQVREGASGGKFSVGLLLSLWSASSGVASLIEALNVAFGVEHPRSWLRRRWVAVLLTLGMAALLTAGLGLLFASSTLGALLSAHVQFLNRLHHVSDAASWATVVALSFGVLLLVYGFGPNVQRKHWQGIFPGAVLALAGAAITSLGLRYYLDHFGSLGRSYGSLGGVVALLFWLYVTAAAILAGGELNAIILSGSQSVPAAERPVTQPADHVSS